MKKIRIKTDKKTNRIIAILHDNNNGIEITAPDNFEKDFINNKEFIYVDGEIKDYDLLNRINTIHERISELLSLLSESDYVVIKMYEAELAGDPTNGYSEAMADRKEWRAEINILEDELKELKIKGE